MTDRAEHDWSDAPGAEDSAAETPARDDWSPTEPMVKTWRLWVVSVSALEALLVSLVLLAGDGLAGVLNNLGGPRSASTWLGIAAAGHGALALSSAVVFGVGLWKPSRRRAAVVAAWAIIPVGIGWFILCGRLAAG